MVILKLFPDMQSHLAGWQHVEKRIPHSPCFWYAEILQSYSVRREQGAMERIEKRACSFSSTVKYSKRRERKRGFTGPTRHVSQCEEQRCGSPQSLYHQTLFEDVTAGIYTTCSVYFTMHKYVCRIQKHRQTARQQSCNSVIQVLKKL